MLDAFLSLAPVGLALGVWRLRRVMPHGSVWLAAAVSVSTVGDLWAWSVGGAWYPSYVWLPVQMACVVRAVSGDHGWREWWAALACLGLYDMLAVTGPEVLVTATGSVAALVFALRSGHRLTVPVALYFGVGTVAYLGMVATIGNGTFMLWWWAYQGCRVLAWIALAEIVRHRWWRDRRARRHAARDRMTFGPRMLPHMMRPHPN